MWKISPEARTAYDILLEDSSVIQAVLNNVENLPGVSVDLKHNFGRELLTRIKSRDDRKFHNEFQSPCGD